VGAIERGAGGDRTELRRVHVPEGAAVPADGRSRCAHDHDIVHGHNPSIILNRVQAGHAASTSNLVHHTIHHIGSNNSDVRGQRMSL
jgi:hypothetical protein